MENEGAQNKGTREGQNIPKCGKEGQNVIKIIDASCNIDFPTMSTSNAFTTKRR